MEEKPPPYSSTTPPQPPPYSSEPNNQGVPPPAGFQVPQQGGVQEPVSTPATACLQPAPTQIVVVQQRGSCPICKMGHVREEFTLLGVCLGIFLFPLGLICCLMMRVSRCSNCRAIVI